MGNVMTFQEVVDTMGNHPTLPHYNKTTLLKLLSTASEWAKQGFGSGVEQLFLNLGQHPVAVLDGRPLVVSSDLMGEGAWMEDFTLFSINPDIDWDTDLVTAMRLLDCPITIKRTLKYAGQLPSIPALMYDPTKGLTAKQRSDISRAVHSVGDVTVAVEMPTSADLKSGVTRWNRHAMSGDYFLSQWLWVSVAGFSVQVSGDGFKAWAGFVRYDNLLVFTAYHAVGTQPSGVGTATLNYALDYALTTFPECKVILTVPLDAETAKVHRPDVYETYKRRFANDKIDTHFLVGQKLSVSNPCPPYYDAFTDTEHVS